MKPRSMFVLLCVLFGLSSLVVRAAEQSGLAGVWTIDPARSSSIGPWEKSVLTISLKSGDEIQIQRELSWGQDRASSDTTVVKADGHTVVPNAIGFWLDTWYSNLYAGGDGQKKVTAQWLVPGRVLKTESDFALEGQQGDHPVHAYDEYRLSADGRTLTQIQVRSTRDRALTYVYTRR